MSDPALPPDSHPTADPAPDGATRTAGGPAAEPAEPPGRVSPPGYDLHGEVGRGGMGVVYRAHDTHLNRDVAVKILQGRYAPGSFAARRFVEEARITGQLQHPGIPPVHAIGTLPDGRPFIAMKLIKGRTLADRTHRPARGELVAVFEQVCQAVGYAHSHGVIHRDLKPQNVMVGAFGEVQVMDWGLAKFRSETRAASAEVSVASTFYDPRDDTDEDSKTRAGSFLGTPAYMAPEQALGAVDRIDERSDVFGLGGVLCVILTGEPPFLGADAESTRLISAQGKLDGAFARLDQCGAEPEWVALCKRCLAADPADRPANAGEVARAVAGLRAEAEDRAKRAELDRVRAEGELRAAEVQAAEQRKRRKVQAALGLAFTALVALAGAFAWWHNDQEGRRTAEALQRQIEDERRAADERARLARSREAVAVLLGQCEDALRADDPGKAELALLAAEKQAADGGAEPLADRLARCRADLDILRDLNRIDVKRWTPAGGYLPGARELRNDLAAAFAKFGADPDAVPPDEAARRVNGSAVRDRLLSALDWWATLCGMARAPTAGVLATLRAADPDEFRDAVREAFARDDGARVRALAETPAALDQPARFAVAFAVQRNVQVVPAARREAILLSALRDRPGNYGVLMTLGRLRLSGTGQLSQNRERWFRAAVAVRPGSTEALVLLGDTLGERGDFDAATDCYRRALRLDPKQVSAHHNLGVALHRTKDLDGAIAAFREAIRLISSNPTVALAHNNLGIVLRERGEVDGAATAFGDAGKGYLRDRKFDAAAVAFRDAVRLKPQVFEYHDRLGAALAAAGDLPGAAAAYREAARLAPDEPAARAGLGHRMTRLGYRLALARDVDAAAAVLQEAVEIDPASTFAWNTLAWILAAGPDGVRDGKRAVEHATRVCELTGWNDPIQLNLLAAAYAAADDFDKALEYNAKALAFPEFEKVYGAHARMQRELYRQKQPYRDPALARRKVAPPPRAVGR